MGHLFRGKIYPLFLFAAVAFLVAFVFFFLRLDQIVHADLYNYGLQYSDEWAIPYVTYKNFMLIFIGIAASVNIFGLAYLLLFKPTLSQLALPSTQVHARNLEPKLSIIFLLTGGLALTKAVFYSSVFK